MLWRVEPQWRANALRWKRFTYHMGSQILPDWHVWHEAHANAQRFKEALLRAHGHNGSVEGDVWMYEFWRLAATTPERVPPMLKGWEPWARFVGQRFADVPNPLEPWLDVWALGFGIDAIQTDAIVLVAQAEVDDG